MTDTDDAGLAALTRCRINVRAARVDAMTAADTLTGARHTRAEELAEKLADALAFCEKLITITTGDLRADSLSDPTGTIGQ